MTTATKPIPLPSFGIVPSQYDSQWYSAFVAQLSRRISLLAGPYTIQPQLLLQAPNGSVFKVVVDNSGNLSATAVVPGDVPAPI
jgi:hypothetical protein